MNAYLATMQIKAGDAKKLFQILKGRDGDEVAYHEFIQCFGTIQGQPSNADLVYLSIDVAHLTDMVERVLTALGHITRQTASLNRRVSGLEESLKALGNPEGD